MSKIDENDLLRRAELIGRIEPDPDATIRAIECTRAALQNQTTKPVGLSWEVLTKMLQNNFGKLAAAAVIVIGFVTIANFFATSTNDASLAWADVLETTNRAPTVHFVHTITSEDGSVQSGEYWIDCTRRIVLMLGKSYGSEFCQRYDAMEKTSISYNSKTQTIEKRLLSEELASLVVPDGDILGWLLRIFGDAMLPSARSLDNWQRVPDDTPGRTVFALESELPHGDHVRISIRVEDVTQLPAEMDLEMDLRNQKSSASVVFDYPLTVPTTFEEIGIDLSHASMVGEPHNTYLQIPGRLTDSQNHPVQGTVIINENLLIETQSDGTFAIPKSYWPSPTGIRIGFAYDRSKKRGRILTLRAEDLPELLHIVVEPLATITGRLVDKDGNCVSDATARIIIEGISLGSPPWKTRIDRDGQLEISELPLGPKEMYLLVEKPGFQTKIHLRNLEPSVQSLGDIQVRPVCGFDDTTEWNRILSGRILDENNNPIFGARVHSHIPGGLAEDETDSKGRYRLKDLPIGQSFELWVYHAGYGHNRFDVEPDTSETLDLQILPQGYESYGKPAPPLRVEEWWNSEPLSVDQLRGKVVLLHVGIHIDQYYPEFALVQIVCRARERYAQRGLVLVAIHKEKKAGWPRPVTLTEISASLEKNRIDFPVALDEDGGSTYEAYDVKASPAMYLIDKKGILRCSPTEHNLDEWIRRLLDEQ